jgi:hypothetical protein
VITQTRRHPYTAGRWKPGRTHGAPKGAEAPDGTQVSLAVVRAVWAYISRHPRASVADVADAVGLRSRPHALAALRILEGAGYIRRPVTPPGRSLARTWVVVVPLLEVKR